MQEFDFKYVVNDTYMAVRYYGDEADVVIPDTWYGKPVSVLGEDLFKGHTEIRSIRIPASVTHIMGFVFDGCTSLQELILPEGLYSILPYAFVRCGLRSVILPAGVTQIPPYAFYQCRLLEKIEIRAGKIKIYGHAFDGCDRLKHVPQANGS